VNQLRVSKFSSGSGLVRSAMFQLRFDKAAFGHAVDEITKKQVPFAAAVALTRSARQGLLAVQKSIPQRFIIRKRGLLARFRMVRASKRDWPNLQAFVGSLDKFWSLQESGGTKKPTGSGTIAIPTRLARPHPTAKIRKSNLPGEAIQAGRARPEAQVIRLAKPRKSDPRSILYLRRKSATIPRRLGMEETLHDEVGRVYDAHFKRELEAALRSRRVREGKFTTEGARAAYLSARIRVDRG
jgi:hypothetical protein